jgi:hypothetical protein
LGFGNHRLKPQSGKLILSLSGLHVAFTPVVPPTGFFCLKFGISVVEFVLSLRDSKLAQLRFITA